MDLNQTRGIAREIELAKLTVLIGKIVSRRPQKTRARYVYNTLSCGNLNGCKGRGFAEVYGRREDFVGNVLRLSGRPAPQKVYPADHQNRQIEVNESIRLRLLRETRFGTPSVKGFSVDPASASDIPVSLLPANRGFKCLRRYREPCS